MTEDEIMLTAVLNCRRVDLYTQDAVLSDEQKQRLKQMKHRRENGIPLQVIIGETDFCGLKFCVNSHTLIPRPETEMMVESAMDFISSRDRQTYEILDIGTGSGCIVISLAKKFPFLHGRGIDLSSEALCVAGQNAARHDVTQQVRFDCLDAFQMWPQLPTSFYDMIISNPPYIPSVYLSELPREVQSEPRMALDGGGDGLIFYRDIIFHAPQVLKPHGVLMCEFWDGQDAALKELFDQRWHVDFYQDLSGVRRFFKAHYLP